MIEEKAGELLLEFVDGRVTQFIQSEVLDLNEDRFRQDVWEAKLYGYLFGRGNQQLSAKVLERIGKENITVMASKYKMQALEEDVLLVDTGDDRVNELLCGDYDVVVGYRETMKFEAKC